MLCTLNTAFGTIPCAQTGVITITLGQLAILGIVGFIVGIFITGALTFYRWRYGIIVIVFREVGITMRQVYQKMLKPDSTSFEVKLGTPRKKIEYIIDLTRTVWLDNHNRPVLVYEQDTITPLQEERLTAKLKAAIEEKRKGMKIKLRKDLKRPAEPFAITFSRRGMELIIRAITGKESTSKQAIGLAVVFAIMTATIGYFLGSAFPLSSIHAAIHTATNSTSITSTVHTSTSTSTTCTAPQCITVNG